MKEKTKEIKTSNINNDNYPSTILYKTDKIENSNKKSSKTEMPMTITTLLETQKYNNKDFDIFEEVQNLINEEKNNTKEKTKEEEILFYNDILTNIETILSHDVINGLGSLNDEENTSIISMMKY